MRLIGLMILASIALTFGVAAQGDSPKPKVSSDPLTEEQIAIYRAVLKNYMKGSDGPLNLSDRTEPMELPGPFFDKECVKGITLEIAGSSVLVVHKLSPAVAIDSRIVLVDPEQQERKIKENDPQNLVKKAVDDREEVTEKQIDNSVKQAFATGLFTLSEIIYDKPHRRAVVKYSFVCGGLCGHGSMLVLQKVGDKWKVSKTCGLWIS